MFTVLFTDQSTDKNGIAIFRNGKLFYWTHIILSEFYPEKDYISHTLRRLVLIKKIKELIKKYKVNHVVFEDVYSTPNVEVMKKLAKVQGTLEDLATTNEISFEEMKATEWRSYLPLKFESKKPKREEIKRVVCKYIDEQYPELVNEIEDVKEAVAIGLGWIKKQEEMMGKIK